MRVRRHVVYGEREKAYRVWLMVANDVRCRMVCGTWRMEHGVQPMVHEIWCMVYRASYMVFDVQHAVHGEWYMPGCMLMYDVRNMASGVWYKGHDA